MLVMYFMAMRSIFHDATQLSMTVDCARLGKKNRFLCAIANRQNQAAWAPPQVFAPTYIAP